MIELKNISVNYGTTAILKDVSIAFEKGKLTSIIGVNGCGKSTLLKAILALTPLNSGEILIDQTSINNMTRNEIARKAAYLAQGKNTPDMTVEQMVLHGRFPHLNYPRRYTKQDYDLAFASMKQVGIEAYAHKSLQTLSGGMRQNAYIAMALAQSTDYILLDEPTTYLDIAHQLELMKTLRALADAGKSIIAVMHDLPMAFTFSDQIVLLNEKQIVLNDTPERVYKEETIARVFKVSIAHSTDDHTYSYKF